MRPLLTLLLVVACVSAVADFAGAGGDRTVSGQSTYPIASDLSRVGRYPPVVKSGAGYFYDEVLEYRVWLHPERGAEKKNGNDDYFVSNSHTLGGTLGVRLVEGIKTQVRQHRYQP